MKKGLCILLTAVFLAMLVFTGCGQQAATGNSRQPGTQTEQNTSSEASSEKSTEKVRITFWDENAGPNETPYYEEMLKKFHETHQNIEVEYVGIPWETAKQKFDVAIAGNEVPDCSGIVSDWLSNFVNRGALLSIDTYFQNWSEKDKFPASIMDNLRDTVSDSNLYLLPTSTNMIVLWLRSDWLREAGLSTPETWDEFYNCVEKLTDKSKGRYGFSIRGGAGGPNQLYPYLYAYSGLTSYFDENGKSNIDDPLCIEAMEKLASIYNVYTPESDIGNGYKEMVAAFDTGAAAMIMHNLGSYGEHSQTLEAGQFEAIALPKAVTGKRILGSGARGHSIYKNSKNPDAAWELVSFFATAEMQSYWDKSIGELPVNTDVMDDDWVKNAQHINMALSTLADGDSIVVSAPSFLPEWQTIMDKTVLSGFQAVLAGKMSAKELLTTWADEITKSKADYDKANS